MFFRAWQLLLVIALLAVVAASVRFGQSETPIGQTGTGGSTDVEGYLEVTDAEDNSVYSGAYAVAVGLEYTLRYTAEKILNLIDSEMDMRITLPPQLQQTGGATTWSGQDKRMILEVQVKPTEAGETEVLATATNLSSDSTAINTITVHVTGTVAEAKRLFDKPAE
jgi:hypothetical protein